MSINSVIQPILLRLHPNQNIQLQHFTPFRSIVMGAGICYAIEENKYWHLPITFLFPSVYAGYQAYKHRGLVKKFVTV